MMPKKDYFWVTFDLANGHKPTKRYLSWFDSLKEAKEHIRWQKAQGGAPSSRPFKVQFANVPKEYLPSAYFWIIFEPTPSATQHYVYWFDSKKDLLDHVNYVMDKNKFASFKPKKVGFV